MRKSQTFNLFQAFEDLVREKGLSIDVVESSLQEAILQGIKKKYGHSENVKISFDREKSELLVVAEKTVVSKLSDPIAEIEEEEAKKIKPDAKPGDKILVPLELETLGRNAIYTIKQRLAEKLRDVEREKVFHDFQHKKGEIVTGVVQRMQKGDIIVNLGRTEGIIPRSEQLPLERYQQGRPIRAYVIDVKNSPKSPQIILSRRAPEFLKKLFEFEVPEIYEGRVEIVRVAREPGERSKIAVVAVDEKIDPVGACVGLKGIRVQAVVKELNNEKIDVIQYDPDPEKFVARALAPATVLFSEIYPEEKRITVVVEDDKLSLAIGKGGQNARLAAKLTNWRITLYSKSQYEKIQRGIEGIPNMTPEMAEKLKKQDIDTVHKLARAKPELVKMITGVSEEEAWEFVRAARHIAEEINQEYGFISKAEDSEPQGEEPQEENG